MKKAGTFFVMITCLVPAFCFSQDKKETIVVPAEWYIACDTVYTAAFHFHADHSYAFYEGNERYQQEERGTWLMQHDSVLLFTSWFREYDPHGIPLCLAGVPMLPDTSFLVLENDTAFYFIYSGDKEPGAFLPLNNSTTGIASLKKLHAVFPFMDQPVLFADPANPAGNYLFSTMHGFERIELNTNGSFTFYEPGFRQSGTWQVKTDTLVCTVKKSKGAPNNHQKENILVFYFYEGKLFYYKPAPGELPGNGAFFKMNKDEYSYCLKHG